MEQVCVHNMTCYDIPEVLEIEKMSFKTPWSEEAFKSEIGRNLAARYITARYDGKLVGYGGMWVISGEAHITNIAVHPDYRGIHIGDLILKTLVKIAALENAHDMTLEVRKSNYIAQNLYKKYGFLKEGIRRRYYTDTGEDAIIMWRRDA
ncbi:MAG: ribosomal protein S18-alanine N-acetyltransferase [Clostridiales bacterium]|nr:ribosomal protein S18-alanine N-acetyltransferase [Clostridiales bacterium]HBM79946.1 ribosomal-protein-alanine N-acetyltransferase [Clostridiaceae bacterium]